MRVAIYIRVSQLDQHPENQAIELRRYVAAHGWDVVEFIEHGVSGARDTRPQLDAMLKLVYQKRVDAIVVWKLDRLGRSMRHLVTLLDELRAVNVGLVTIGEGIDTTTPAGRMVFGIIASLAEFERERLRERTMLGLARARAQGKRFGRPPDVGLRERVRAVSQLSVREAARVARCSVTTVQRFRKVGAARRASLAHPKPLQ